VAAPRIGSAVYYLSSDIKANQGHVPTCRICSLWTHLWSSQQRKDNVEKTDEVIARK